jgi:two-component system, NtrC family, response regulator AtoC
MTRRLQEIGDHDATFSAHDALAATRICGVGGLLGESAAMQVLFEQIARAAAVRANTLIIGESGSGKELAARCLHQLSERASQPFLLMNCSSLAPSLVESELFGYEPGGTGTGAVSRLGAQHGYLERAGAGTLLLEDIASLSADLQLKLLRALESGRVLRVGGCREIEVHCRVVATAPADTGPVPQTHPLNPQLLEQFMVCAIFVPPLRERGDDVELLAQYFLNVLNAEEGATKRLSGDSLACLHDHTWPGNVRELRNAVHRAFILADGDLDLRSILDRASPLSAIGDDQMLRIPVGTRLAEVERRMIVATLRKCAGNKTRAAALLGVSLKTLYNRLNAYRAEGLDVGDTDREFIEVAN